MATKPAEAIAQAAWIRRAEGAREVCLFGSAAAELGQRDLLLESCTDRGT